jgi:hypothetical protein
MYKVPSTYLTTRCWPRQRHVVSCGVARRLEDDLGFHDGGKARQGLRQQHKGRDGCPHLRRRDVLIIRGSGHREHLARPVSPLTPSCRWPVAHYHDRPSLSRTCCRVLQCIFGTMSFVGATFVSRTADSHQNNGPCGAEQFANYSRCRDWGLLPTKNSILRSSFGAWLQSVHMHEIKLVDRSERYETIDIDCGSIRSRGREVGISPIAQYLRFC